jgi:hypothetical protein
VYLTIILVNIFSLSGLCYIMPVTGHKAYTGKEEEEEDLFIVFYQHDFHAYLTFFEFQ